MGPLALLSGIEVLDLRGNCLEQAEALADQLLPQLPRLRSLSVAGNPFAQRDPKYREKLVLASDSVEEIDGKEVTRREREFLLRFAIHKIKSQGSGSRREGQQHQAEAQHQVALSNPATAAEYGVVAGAHVAQPAADKRAADRPPAKLPLGSLNVQGLASKSKKDFANMFT